MGQIEVRKTKEDQVYLTPNGAGIKVKGYNGGGNSGNEVVAEINAKQIDTSGDGKYNDITCSMTFTEIADAIRSGKRVIGKALMYRNTSEPGGKSVLISVYSYGEFYLLDTDVDSTMYPRTARCHNIVNTVGVTVTLNIIENGTMSFVTY